MKVLICDAIAESAVNRLKTLPGIEVLVKTGMTPDELKTVIPPFECVVVRSATKIRQDVIDLAPNLKLIIRGGVGVDNIDAAYAKSKGIAVRNTPGASSASVAELAIGLMFAVARKIGFANCAIKAGKWEKKSCRGIELAGKTLGIIGIGRIGREVAKRALALGMKVIAHDSMISSLAMEGVRLVAKDELVRAADFITLHVPFDAKLGALLKKEDFEAMKKGVIIINCARGGVVDEQALTEALTSGKVAGAGVDVFAKEPPAYEGFVTMPQVVCTPHIGGETSEAQDRVGAEVVDIIAEQ